MDFFTPADFGRVVREFLASTDWLGYVACGLVVLTFCMQAIVPLRLVALASNFAFISYSWAAKLLPIFILHISLAAINLVCLCKIVIDHRETVSEEAGATRGDLEMVWVERPSSSEGERGAVRGQRYSLNVLLVPFAIITGGLAFAVSPGLDRVGCLIVLLCAAMSSIAGFAFSAISLPFLALVGGDPADVVQTMVTASIALQSYAVWKLRKDIAPLGLLPYFAGGIATLGPGIYLLLNTPQHLYFMGLGVLLVAYASMLLCRPVLRMRSDPLAMRVVMGGLGGITGAVAAFPGASVTIWCAAHGWPKERQRALYQPFILGMQILTLCALAALQPSHVLRAETLQYAVPAVAGAWIGFQVFLRLSPAQFNKILSIFLLVSGIALCAKAL